MEDNRSVCSGNSQGSVSLSKVECPHCKTEFQQRALFNHIRVKHSREMITMTSKKFLEEAIKGFPLCIYWEVKNDFDELEEEKIYVCLSSNKTFKTEERGNLHFQKSPDHKKKHISHAKMLLKEIAAEKKKSVKKTHSNLVKIQELSAEKQMEMAKAIWRGIVFHQRKIEIGLHYAEVRQLEDDYVASRWNKIMRRYDYIPWKDLHSICHHQLELIECLKVQREMNVKVLQKVWDDLYRLWNNDLATSLPWCEELQERYQGMWKEEFFYYANETMPEVQF